VAEPLIQNQLVGCLFVYAELMRSIWRVCGLLPNVASAARLFHRPDVVNDLVDETVLALHLLCRCAVGHHFTTVPP